MLAKMDYRVIEKSEYVNAILRDICGCVNPTGMKHICYILTTIWEKKDFDWFDYDKYIVSLSEETEKQKDIISAQIKKSINITWFHGDQNILKSLFGYSRDHANAPTWKLFIRTIMSVLFYCVENRLDMLEILTRLKAPEQNKDNDFNLIMMGYVIKLLKQLDLSDVEIDKSIPHVNEIVKNTEADEALITYIKYSSPLFTTVSVGDIIIPPALYNETVWNIEYDDHISAIKIGNALCKSGIYQLKDLRYKSHEDIRNIRNIGSKSYECFIKALTKTINNFAA